MSHFSAFQFTRLSFACALILGVSITSGFAESTAKQFPDGAIAVLEIHQLSSLIERVEKSDLPEYITGTPQYAKYLGSDEYRKAKAGLTIAETVLGIDALSLSKQITAGDIGVAVYPVENSEQPDSLLFIKVPDPAILKHLREKLEPFLVLIDAQDDETERSKVETFHFQDKAYFALGTDWLYVANQSELLQRALTLDNEDAKSAADDPNLQLMNKNHGTDHLASLYVNTKMISDGAGGRFLPSKMDNPVGSLLLGGVLEMAAHSPYAGITLDVLDNEFILNGVVQGEKKGLPESHQVFFADADKAGTMPFPELDDRQFGFTLNRDFTTWYQQREELLEEQVLPAFDQFETGIGNLLPGRDFGTDILPLMGRNLTFITAPQDYSHLDGTPGIQLPGMALIVELEDPEEGAQVIQLFFQTLASILNIQAGQEGRQPWLIMSEVYNDTSLQAGKYMQKPKGDRLPMVFNFMPASARLGDRYILSTSVDMCKSLIDEAKGDAPASRANGKVTNRDLHIDLKVAPVVEALVENRTAIQAQSLKDGKTLEEAEADFDVLISLLRRIKELNLQTGAESGTYQLKFSGSWN